MEINNYDIIKTIDDLWLYANRSVQKEGGVFGYLKYASCKETESTTNIEGIPCFRVWSRNPKVFKDSLAERVSKYYCPNSISEAKFFIPYRQIEKVYMPQQAVQRILNLKAFNDNTERDCNEFVKFIWRSKPGFNGF